MISNLSIHVKPQKIKRLTNNDNAKLSKVQELQGKSERQTDIKAKDDSFTDIHGKQDTEPLIKLAKPVEDDEESKADKL